MSWFNRFFSKDTFIANQPSTFIGFMPSLITAEEALENLNFKHGDRRIVTQESSPETIIMITGGLKEKEVREVRQKICANSVPTEKVVKILNPILVDMSKRKLCSRCFILSQPETI